MGNSVTCEKTLQDPERSKEQTYIQTSGKMKRDMKGFSFSLGIQGDHKELIVTPEVMTIHRTKGKSGGRGLSGKDAESRCALTLSYLVS